MLKDDDQDVSGQNFAGAEFDYAVRRIELDRSAAKPIFKQLYEALRAAILEGGLPSGAKLPPIRNLSEALNVSRNTVSAAYEQLVAEGVCHAKTGGGTRIAADLQRHRDKPPPAPPDRGSAARFDQSLRTRLDAGIFSPASTAIAGIRPGAPDVRIFPRTEWAYALSRACRYASGESLVHENHSGFAPLRAALASYLNASRGVRCDAEQIFIINGAHLSYEMIMATFTDPGDVVAVEDPGYSAAVNVARQTGQTVISAETDRFGMDVKTIAGHAPKLIFTTPAAQIPLGVEMSMERRKALLDFAGEKNAIIIEANHGAEFEYGSNAVPSLHALDGEARVFYVGSFSEAMFPTLRVSYVVAPKSAVPALSASARRIKTAPSYIIQSALADFLDSGAYAMHVKRARGAYFDRLKHFIGACERYLPDWARPLPIRSGLVVSLVFSRHCDDRAVAEAADRAGVPVWPLSEGYLGQPGLTGLIVGFASGDESEITKHIEALGKVFADFA